MQSTGHSSMQARSSTSTQGKAMMYVTYKLLCQPLLGAGAGGTRLSIAESGRRREADPASTRCRQLRRHGRLSAERDPRPVCRTMTGLRLAGPALPAMGGGPLVAVVAHVPDTESTGMAHQPGRHGPPQVTPADPHQGGGVAGMADRQPAEGSPELRSGRGQLGVAADAPWVPAPDVMRPMTAESARHGRALRSVLVVG